MTFTFEPIGIIHSCFKEKFGIPRQSGLVTEATAELELLPPFNREEALAGLDGFSHLWITFVFHGALREGWKPTVRPPRLGGNKRMGVFATRSNFRPNPIGLSAVKYSGVTRRGKKLILAIEGADLLDRTPVLDIKPYLPYADSLPEATGGFAPEPPAPDLIVAFNGGVEPVIDRKERGEIPNLRRLITQMLENDPRPAYHAATGKRKSFAFRIFDLDVRWEVCGNQIRVTAIDEIP